MRKQLATLALIGLLALNTVVHVVEVLPHLAQTHRYNTDAAAATDCAARLFLQGHDPYLNIRMLTCLHSNGLGPSQTTPRQAGTFWIFRTYPSPMTAHFQYLRYRVYWRELRREQRNPAYRTPEFETRFNYPGAAILIAALALLLGSRDLVPLYLGCALVASILIYRRTDPRTRWATGLLLLGDTPLLLDEVGGTTDSLYALLLILAWQIRARPLVAGLLLGLAAASRQQAWFFVPFLLYLGWRHSGWSDLVRRGAATLAVFLVGNLPFIIASPEDWLTGVLGPGRDPTFAQGVGLVALSIARILPLGPPAVYGALEWIVLVAGFLYFTRRCMTSPGLAMFLPLLPLVVAWRSLHTYFLLIPLLATAVLAGPPDPSAESQVESMPLLHLRSIASPSASRRWTIRG